ncbi:MAG TPA: uridine kinase [Pseudonocardiaceae bacterium]|nr:uridine kinase [Pseudonocardiaceae bacterium]
MVAIDGPSGAGKSTAAAHLVAQLRAQGLTVAEVPTDHFATWADPVSWWPRLVAGVLTPLRDGRPGAYRRMDWATGSPRLGEWVDVPVPDVLVVEGMSAGRRSVREFLTLLAWVDLPDAQHRLARAVARDGECHRAELAAWQRFERGWFAVDGTRDAADLRVPGGSSDGRLVRFSP